MNSTAAISRLAEKMSIAQHAARIYRILRQSIHPFRSSSQYWERRYARHGTSGAGSYGKFAAFKAEVINRIVREWGIHSVIEFGCGDGNQLQVLKVPQYIGFDVSQAAIHKCKAAFAADGNKHFALMRDYNGQRADLSLSLDVIYHLVEPEVFEQYMRTLFNSAIKLIAIYSSDVEPSDFVTAPHVRHRKFTHWVDQNIDGWVLSEVVPNPYPYNGNDAEGSLSEFYIYVPRS